MPAKSRSRHGVPRLEDLLPAPRPPAPPPAEPPAASVPVPASVEEQAAYLRAIAWPIALYGSLAGVMGDLKDLKAYKALTDDFAAKVYLGAAARLMGEFRAHAVALKALRAPAHAEPATAPQAPPPASAAPPAPVARGELGSNRVKGYYGAALAEVS